MATELNEPVVNNSGKNRFQAKMGKGLSFKTYDGNYKANLSGLLQADGVYNSDKTLVAGETDIRRGRVTLGMQFYRHWDLRATYDFTAKDLNIQGFQDLYLRYTGIRRTDFKMGNLKELIGLEWQGSSRNTTFMERSLLTSVIPPYHLGFATSTHGDSWSVAAGVFGDRLIDGIRGDNGWGTSSRLTFTPILQKETILHLGLSGVYREPGRQSSNLGADSQSGFNVENARFSSISRVTDFNEILAAEIATVRGPVSLQAEYLRTFLNHNSGSGNLEYDAWYAYGSWFLTGESRDYNAKSGVFGHIKPKQKFNLKGGLGAWEIAARYNELNLLGQHTFVERENNTTVAVNWHLNDTTKLMANYVFVQTNLNAPNGRNQGQGDADIFAMRLQVEF